ncbi:MAG: ATP-binding protein [Burkholderiaceae bacterium]|nr:ATP-binding protein [Burkholderiaceae bacterium]
MHCSVQQGGHRLTIDTRNAGRAIAPELMAHLFEPFVGTNESGHGLGLWVTYQVVTQLGGRIAADQRDGLTCFHVSLPIGELDG